MEHTPVPWKIVGKDTDPWTIAPADWQRSGDDTIAEITYTGADAEANAAYIVRACNNFEDMQKVGLKMICIVGEEKGLDMDLKL